MFLKNIKLGDQLLSMKFFEKKYLSADFRVLVRDMLCTGFDVNATFKS